MVFLPVGVVTSGVLQIGQLFLISGRRGGPKDIVVKAADNWLEPVNPCFRPNDQHLTSDID